MKRKRLLITISFSFSIRYIYRSGLLKKLKEFCDPVVLITWNQKDLIAELKEEGFEVHIVPESRRGDKYSSIRKKIDIWFRYFILKSPSEKFQQKYLDQFLSSKTKLLRNTRKWHNIIRFYFPGFANRLFNIEKKLLLNDTNYSELSAIVNNLNIDAVFTITPFHTQEDFVLRASENFGKTMITAILSFDNITKRGWIPVNYDVYMVWNKYNADQLKRIYPTAVKSNNIYITGAPQFDFYFNKSYQFSHHEWRQKIGFKDVNKKIILYAGGPVNILKNEMQYVKALDEAINNGDIAGNPFILFRCHPVDKLERWKDALSGCKNVFFEASWSGTDKLLNANITNNDIKQLCSTLAYTDVHINFCSTMTVDGSAFNKPQIAPCYDDINKNNETLLENLYYHEHFLPIVNSKGLHLARSKQQFINYVNQALQNPEPFVANCKTILKEIITYYDGKNVHRVAEVIRQCLCPAKEVETIYN